MGNTNTLLKSLFNPQAQINQGEQIPQYGQVPQADVDMVGQKMFSPTARSMYSEILKGGSMVAGAVNPLAGAGMYAAGTAIDPSKTIQEKTAPKEIRNQLAMLAMGSMGKGGKYFGDLPEEVAKLAQANKLSRAEAEIMAERAPPQVRESIRQIPTAVEKHLKDAKDAGVFDWQTESAEKGFELLKQQKGGNLTPEDIMNYWKGVK